MRIGIFDSGLGGLYLLRSLLSSKLRGYDFVFLGDTKNLPYGDKSQKEIYKLTSDAVRFLFDQGCELVIVACNTASAQALRKIQTTWLKSYPGKKVLGIIRPTVELVQKGNVLVLATSSTVKAKAYTKELKNFNPKLKVHEIAAPELVQLIEANQKDKILSAIEKYTHHINHRNIYSYVLGCTHYALYKREFNKRLPKTIKIISQDEVLPSKLRDYLDRHPEIKKKLSKKREQKFYVTRLNKEFLTMAKKWFGKKVKLNLARY